MKTLLSLTAVASLCLFAAGCSPPETEDVDLSTEMSAAPDGASNTTGAMETPSSNMTGSMETPDSNMTGGSETP